MKLNIIGKTAEIKSGLEVLAKRMDLQLVQSGGYEVSVEKQKTGLNICVKDGKCRIAYNKASEFFRALSIVVFALQSGEPLSLKEEPAFDMVGVMLDVSRNAVPKVETVKDLLERLALMGINTMMLYTEDTFKMKKYPYFGYLRGAYSKEELRELDLYAEKLGIELVPCIQTLAHLGSTLRWAYAREMKDYADALLIDEPKTYEFIEEMFKTLSECLSSRKIHLGMDEADGVGLGKYLKLHGYEENRFPMLLRHLNRVMEIARRYGYKPMAWSDMFIREATHADYYDNGAVIQENICGSIPDDLQLVYWDYYNEDEESYRASVRKHKALGGELTFAGGSWIWGKFTPSYDKTIATAHPALRVCRKEKVDNVFVTLWGDDGAEGSFYAALLGVQLFAEYNFYETVSDEHLEKMFKVCTGFDMKAFLALDVDWFPGKRIVEPQFRSALCFSKFVLLQDVLLGTFDESLKGLDLKAHYTRCLERLERMPPQRGLEYLFDFYRQLIRVLCLKCDINTRLIESYQAKDTAVLTKIAKELRALYGEVQKLHQGFADIWYRDYKPFGFECQDLRFGGLKERIARAADRVEGYLAGELAKLEELEENRLLYNGIENSFRLQAGGFRTYIASKL